MMVTLPDLYPHQEDVRDRTRDGARRLRRVILAANPGFGKTRVAKWMLGSTLQHKIGSRQSGRSLFTVHRRGLVDNASDSFNESPRLPHGVIMSGRDTSYGSRVQVASIDTLLNWFVEAGGRYPSDITFDLIVLDECHSHHPKFAKFVEAHDRRRDQLDQHPAYVIGLSATPQAKGLADVYHDIVCGPPTEWLIANGYLSPFRYFRATQGKLDLLVKRGGEFTSNSVSAAMAGLSGDLVRDWQQYGKGRPTVGFFPRRSHAKDAMVMLEAAGARVGYVDGDTDDDDRKRIFSELNNGRLDYLANVAVVERGTDIPRIGCVQLCLAIGSITRYRQMIGRGSRCHPAKTDCVVIDHGGNVMRHGFFEDDPQWTLANDTKEVGEVGPRPRIECPRCSAIYRGGLCRSCGYEPTTSERSAQGLHFDGSELVEVERDERPEPSPKTAEQMLVSALYAAGRSGRTWRQACGIFKTQCKRRGMQVAMPAFVEVAGHRYRLPKYGSSDSSRRVSAIFPFTVARGHGGKYLEQKCEV